MTRRAAGGWWRTTTLLRRVAAQVAAIALVSVHLLPAQQKVPLVLNHMMIVLDSATYHDVTHSPFVLGQLAAVDTGFLHGYDGGVGIRLMGRFNFLTMVPPVAAFHRQAGDAAIVLATTRPGDLAMLGRQGSFRSSGILSASADTPLRADEYNDASQRLSPIGVDLLSDRARLAIMEYAAFLVRDRARIDSLPPSDLATSRFLAPYFDRRRLFAFLTGATLAIPVADIAKVSRVLARDGVTVIAEGEGAIVKLDGFTLHLIPSFVGAGVKQLQFALTRTAVGNPIYRFGPWSQLRFGPGPIAVWDFSAQ